MIDHLLTLFHYVWSFALIISIIVFIHEFGHFIAARLCGVKVETFSIGFGREIIGRTDRHGTRWKLAALPLGGYVKMLGDATVASNADTQAIAAMPEVDRKRTLHAQPLWKKAIIVAAGPAANFLLTISVFTYFIFSVGIASTEPVVGTVIPDTPAASAGLLAGDRIMRVDGKEMRVFSDIPEALMLNLYTPLKLEVLRGGKAIEITLTPIAFEEKDPTGNIEKRPLIGIRSDKIMRRDVSVPEAIWVATAKTYQMCVINLRALGQMISGERSVDGLKGTLGIAKLSGDVTQQGDTTREALHTFLWFVASLSAGIGLFNILPLPVLDGGHLLFYAIEAVRGRPMAERIQEFIYRIGVSFIVVLMVFTLYNDARQML